jgi:hypothetical protein
MNSNDLEVKLNQSFDEVLFQLSKGISIEDMKKGRLWLELEQVKEWKSKFGFQFHIYSNDHLLKTTKQEYKPHFHLKKIVKILIVECFLMEPFLTVKEATK